MIDLGKHNLIGVQIDAVDYEGAVARIINAASDQRRCTTTALAVHGVMTGALDAQHRHRLNRLDLVVPDGMPVRWGLNLLHKTKLPDRVYGPNLMLKTCDAAAAKSIPIYLFGSDATTLAKLRDNLKAKYPNLIIAGAEPSQFRQLNKEESQQMIENIKASGAGITFVGIGCPRQEVWAYEFGDQLNMPVLAVGAAYSFHAGTLAQAPAWIQNNGLEWFYRFTKEPKRLWRRYVYLNPAYLTMLGLQLLGIKKFRLDSTIEPTDRMLYG
jgi:N-acetylglucosaminyldiphosphoundecaprenol N-acetyl-beta-D-mannosaminyltransferase